MFKIIPNPTFEADLKLRIQGAEQTIHATLKYRSVSEYEKFVNELAKQIAPQGLVKANAAIIPQIIEKWDVDVALDDRKALEQLCDNYPNIGFAILQAYQSARDVAVMGN